MAQALQPRTASPSAALGISGQTEQRQSAGTALHLAHDARNWLTVLQIYCDLLRNSCTVSRNGRAWMDELAKAVDQGSRLVISLIDSAQLSASPEPSEWSGVATEREGFDLAALIRRRESLFREMAGSRIRVKQKCTAHAWTKAIEEVDFDRILLNLVKNAIDAMPQGGRLIIELEVANASHKRPFVLRVSDTGNGIATDSLIHIFESGFSTKSHTHDRASRRGFGLTIVQELTLAAGGTVGVKSTPGLGTCFTIALPTQQSRARHPSVVSQQKSITVRSRKAGSTSARNRQSANPGEEQKGLRIPC